MKNELSIEQSADLIALLQQRFEKNMHRHEGLTWASVQERLESNKDKLWFLHQMEQTGGEPDVLCCDLLEKNYTFYDCSMESPVGRRSLCYDPEALQARKDNKPRHSALGMAKEMGIDILTQEQYRKLQAFGSFDNKTSSWIQTPPEIRKLGGGFFCHHRYGHTFLYHNGVAS